MPTVKLDNEELWKEAKISAIHAGVDVKDWFEDAVRKKLEAEKKIAQHKTSH